MALTVRTALAPDAPAFAILAKQYVFSAMVGMARCAVPARVVAGGTNIRETPGNRKVAPLHAARTSQRDVPTTLNRYDPYSSFNVLRLRSPGSLKHTKSPDELRNLVRMAV